MSNLELDLDDRLEYLCDRSQLPGRHARRFYLSDGTEIAVFLMDGHYFAVDNVCPHQQFALLHEGEVDDGIVTCPMHGWSFEIRTGRCVSGSQAKLATFNVVIRDDQVYIERTKQPPKWME